MSKNDDLKLVFVLKVGYNSKNEGLYEFLFSKAPYSIDTEEISELGWDEMPASTQNTLIPLDIVHDTVKLKTKMFNLNCLHESDDRPYEHGYYSIQAIAYEDYNGEEDESHLEEIASIYNDLSIMVFHYGMSKTEVLDIMNERDFVLEGDSLVYNGEIKF